MTKGHTDKTKALLIKELDEPCQQAADLKYSGGMVRQLETSELRYRRLFEAAQDGILILDVETAEITDVNPFLIDMLGYSKEELIGKKLWEVGPFKNTELTKSAFRELQAKKCTRYEDLPLETKNGQQIAVEFVSNVYSVGDDRVIQCNIRDITDRKQAEERLSVSEVRYRRLFETAQDGILILDAGTGQITDVNPFLIDMLGYSKEEFLGKRLWEIGPLKDIEASQQAFQELQSKRYVRYEHLPLQTKEEKQISVEFVSNVYPINGDRVIQCNIRDITERVHAEEELRDYRGQLEEIVKQRTAELEKVNRKLLKGIGDTVKAMAMTVEIKDPYTSGHQQRVSRLATSIAQEMGVPAEQIEGIRIAGIVHDIGKMYVPSEILSKPGRLNASEFELVKMHSQAGYNILKIVEFPWPIAQTVLQHHERMDGSGYPGRLFGKDIILEARILAVADVVEAIASHRPYRPTLGIDKALEEISGKRNSLYDAEVVDACLKVFQDKGFKFAEAIMQYG